MSNPNLKILIVSHNDHKAKEILEEIKDHLADEKSMLKYLYPEYDLGRASRMKKETGAKWSGTAIRIYDKKSGKYCGGRNMPSCRAVGMGGRITGLHPDIGIFDDLVCDQNTQTSDGLEEPKLFLKKAEPLFGVGSEVIVVGTRYEYRDAYQKIIDDGLFDVMLRSAENEDGSLWFRERLSQEILALKHRHMGTYEFSCQYLNNPVHPEDQVFKEDWIKNCIVNTLPKIEEMTRRMAVDPAARISRKSDFSAMVVAGMDASGRIWILTAERAKLNEDQLIDKSLALYKSWKPDSIEVESNAFQHLFRPLMQRAADERGQLINYRMVKRSNKQSKDHRIRSLVPLIQSARVMIPSHMTDLLAELRRYPKEHDDLLDAIETVIKSLSPPEWEPEVDFEKIKREYAEKQTLTPTVEEAMRISRPKELVNVFAGYL